MPKLVISAAHTSISPGAIYQDLREFDLTRKILEKTIPYLEKNKIDFKAVPVDLSLLQRIDWINDTGYKAEDGDIFIEIHVNDGGKRGLEGWFSGDKGKDNYSQQLSEKIVDFVCKKTGYKSQGVNSEYDHELGSLLILNQTNQIATAIEFLYIDNPEDNKILKDDKKLDDLAKNLADAIKDYMDNAPKIDPAKLKNSEEEKDSSPFGSFGGGSDSSLFPTTPGSKFGAGSSSSSKSSSSSSNMLMDRDERKKMIEKTYKKIFGKEAKQSDVNYYLNTGVTEEQLISKLVNSKDFETFAKDANEADELRKKAQTLEGQVAELTAKVNDLNAMHQNMQNLLNHKNQQIELMKQELVQRGVTQHGEYYDPNRVQRA